MKTYKIKHNVFPSGKNIIEKYYNKCPNLSFKQIRQGLDNGLFERYEISYDQITTSKNKNIKVKITEVTYLI